MIINLAFWRRQKKMKKCKFVAEAGMILANHVYCGECNEHHPQWKYPCVCEYGKVAVEPIGYKLCHHCMGRGYLNERLK